MPRPHLNPGILPAASGRPTVLIVDDYPENCRLLYFYLRNDYEVLTAPSGEEALALIEDHPVDLVVMDINLKDGMNGIETTRLLRQRESMRCVPVIAISAYAYPDDRARFLEAGFDEYIPKPIFKERMLRKVRALLETHEQAVWVSPPQGT
jgi:two-component system, NarL family, sensor histidine kinase BarA